MHFFKTPKMSAKRVLKTLHRLPCPMPNRLDRKNNRLPMHIPAESFIPPIRPTRIVKSSLSSFEKAIAVLHQRLAPKRIFGNRVIQASRPTVASIARHENHKDRNPAAYPNVTTIFARNQPALLIKHRPPTDRPWHGGWRCT